MAFVRRTNTLPDRYDSAPRDDGWPSDLLGRADAAYQVEWARWQTIIDGLRMDRSLTADQRAAAIFAMRLRQRIEAKAVRRRLLDAEKPPPRASRPRFIRPDRPCLA